ncbi:Condensin-2 complex subunit H2, partial [Cuculus canorus]
GAPEPEDDDYGADIPENDVEMLPAAPEHVETQKLLRVGSVGLSVSSRRSSASPTFPPFFFCQEMLDPWQSLDPFADSEEKPFKKGRPFLLPRGLDGVVGGKRKRKSPRKLQDFVKWFTAA